MFQYTSSKRAVNGDIASVMKIFFRVSSRVFPNQFLNTEYLF